MCNIHKLILGFLMVAWGASPASAADNSVNITHAVKAVEVTHLGRKVLIERNPDTENMLDPDYSLTSRPCPPFCVQPMNLGFGVETIGELELMEYLGKVGEGASVLVIDSRDGDWPQRSGIIPGAVQLPWQ
jgi:hypothetical protein